MRHKKLFVLFLKASIQRVCRCHGRQRNEQAAGGFFRHQPVRQQQSRFGFAAAGLVLDQYQCRRVSLAEAKRGS